MGEKKSDDQFTGEETARRYDAMLKRVLSTPPKHRTAKGDKANPPKKRGRPKAKTEGAKAGLNWTPDLGPRVKV